MITMTADDATMNVISWIHDFPSQKPLSNSSRCQFAYDFSAGIPLILLIIYGKDPNFKRIINLIAIRLRGLTCINSQT